MRHTATCCHLCNTWIHTVCNNLEKKTFNNLQESATNRCCMACVKKQIIFSSQTDHELKHMQSGKHVPFKSKDIKTFTTQIINRINENSEENSKRSLYYDMDEFNNLESAKAEFSLMYLNISSLQYHFEEPDDLLNTSQTKSSVVGMTESCFKKGISSLSNINLQNYKIEHTPKESEKGGS